MRMLLLASLCLTAPALSADAQDGPMPVDCLPGPYILFFAPDSHAIGSGGAEAVDRALEDMETCKWPRVTIESHREAGERPGVDRERAEAVRARLIARGLAGERIAIELAGAARPRIAVPAGTPEPQNRYVTLTMLP